VCEYVLFLPVMVNAKVPRRAVEDALIVNMELPDGVRETGFGVNEALVFDGRPAMLRPTEVFPVAASVTVTLLLEPRFTVIDEGDREIVKSGSGTFTVTVVLCVPLDPVPVTVTV
jgi:hypothetical protein